MRELRTKENQDVNCLNVPFDGGERSGPVAPVEALPHAWVTPAWAAASEGPGSLVCWVLPCAARVMSFPPDGPAGGQR